MHGEQSPDSVNLPDLRSPGVQRSGNRTVLGSIPSQAALSPQGHKTAYASLFAKVVDSKSKGERNPFGHRRATDSHLVTAAPKLSGATPEQMEMAKSLNSELRAQCKTIRKQDSLSQVFSPPHLTVSVNCLK